METPTQPGTDPVDHLGQSDPLSGVQRQLMGRSMGRRHTRSRTSSNNTGFQSILSFFRFLFNLFSRPAFQKPLYLNRAGLQMKDLRKPPVGRSLNSAGSRSSVGTFQNQPQCGLRRNSCFAVSGFPRDSYISCGHDQIIGIPYVLREPCLSTPRPTTEMQAFTQF